MLSILRGRKTYIVATLIVLHQILGWFLNGEPINLDRVLEAIGLATLRAGISSRQP